MIIRRRRRITPAISLTPMIDVLFVVLMFLLLTTTFKELTFIRVNLPEADTGQRDPARSGIEILIEEGGTVYLDGQPVSLDALGRRLAAVPDKDHAEVRLAADARVDHGHVVAVMDLVRRAGIFRLSIETLTEGRPLARGF